MPTVINQPIDEVLETILKADIGSPVIVNPSSSVIERLVEVAVTVDRGAEIRLLATERAIKEAITDFLTASKAADLTESGTLEIRTEEVDPGTQLFVTSSEVTALIRAGDAVAALSTDDDRFVSATAKYYDELWDSSNSYTIRTPPLSLVRQSLRDDIGSDVEADFESVLASLETARGDGNGLDEVTISLLVAAKNEELLYDISKWGEDVGIASKATFSRTKTTLEDLGLIDTEKVPINVGRPRLRLKFGHEKLEGASADELASVAQSLMV